MKKLIYVFIFSLSLITIVSCIKDPNAEINSKNITELKEEVKRLNNEISELKCLINCSKQENNLTKTPIKVHK